MLFGGGIVITSLATWARTCHVLVIRPASKYNDLSTTISICVPALDRGRHTEHLQHAVLLFRRFGGSWFLGVVALVQNFAVILRDFHPPGLLHVIHCKAWGDVKRQSFLVGIWEITNCRIIYVQTFLMISPQTKLRENETQKI